MKKQEQAAKKQNHFTSQYIHIATLCGINQKYFARVTEFVEWHISLARKVAVK